MPLPNTKKYKYKSLFGKFIVQNPPWRRNPTPPHLLKSTYVTLIKSLHQLCRQCKNHLRLVIFCTHGTDWKEFPSGEVVSTVSSCLINAAFKVHLQTFFFIKNGFPRTLHFLCFLPCKTLNDQQKTPTWYPENSYTWCWDNLASLPTVEERLLFLKTARPTSFPQCSLQTKSLRRTVWQCFICPLLQSFSPKCSLDAAASSCCAAKHIFPIVYI